VSDENRKENKMSTHKMKIIVLLVVLLVLVIFLMPQLIDRTMAFSLDQDAGIMGITIPYAGSLSKDSIPIKTGQVFDFSFTLYGSNKEGQPLWSEIQNKVILDSGNFYTSLGSIVPIPEELSGKDHLWLEVGVRAFDEDEFTILEPRQELSAIAVTESITASSNLTCPHDHIGEVWSADIAWSNGALKVLNYGNGPSIWGWNGGGGNAIRGYAEGSGLGVYGESTLNDGIVGHTSANGKSGVYGRNEGSGFGVTGRSTSGFGGYFDSGNDHFDVVLGGAVGRINTWPDHPNSELYLSSNADIILKLDNDGGGNNVLRVKNSGGDDVCTINEAGQLTCIGVKNALVETDNFGHRLLYAIEGAEVWFEDIGSAELEEGEAFIPFENIFSETVNLEYGYQIFLTPLCSEPVLLFVTDKASDGFTVKGVTLTGDFSDCAFDYRVIAKRFGYEEVRLEEGSMNSEEIMEVVN
jgi:hypothetical protein